MLKIYNTLSRKKEEFKPLKENVVNMYSCGPTVYSYAHIGNFRTYIFMDTLRRVLKYNGYTLNHAMNITDVGHLESDADEGEDKMLKAARKEKKDPYEIAEFYTKAFFEDFDLLNIDRPEIICKATDHINEMIQFVKEIVENGYGYETSKGIYFDISKLDKYPILSSRKVDEQIAGARVSIDEEKKNPEDFALWIKAPENHIMKWNSPWGLAYPGWHIECSAMGRKYLGDEFDIHTGGIDHIPTHHENEIAQSKGATGKIPAKYWMHCNYLQVDGGKMSKSLGNVYTISTLKDKGIHPLAFKLFCFSSHYRNKINFTFDGIEAANKSYFRLLEGYQKHIIENNEIGEDVIEDFKQKFEDAINDDLNMPMALGIVWDVIRYPIKSNMLSKLIDEFDKVLGLKISENAKNNFNEEIKIPDEIIKLIEERKIARENKDWNKSDILRDKIKEMGYIIKDTKNGNIEVEKV
jgi:cysteinyl-tRNA synthetase